jgi:hypothetical protein
VDLTDEEAAILRQAGYTAILGPGWYQLPRIALELLPASPDAGKRWWKEVS